jgi:hypothetical protein
MKKMSTALRGSKAMLQPTLGTCQQSGLLLLLLFEAPAMYHRQLLTAQPPAAVVGLSNGSGHQAAWDTVGQLVAHCTTILMMMMRRRRRMMVLMKEQQGS